VWRFGDMACFWLVRGTQLGGLFGRGVYDAVEASHRLEYHEPFIKGARAFAGVALGSTTSHYGFSFGVTFSFLSLTADH
jgi:hypothetical protein